MTSYFPVSNDQLNENKVTECEPISSDISTSPPSNMSVHQTSSNSQPLLRCNDFVKNEIFNTFYQGRYIRRTTIFIFSFCIGLVTQLNGSALGALKRHYITKRIRELLIGNSRFLICNSLNQLLYYTV